MAESLNKGRQRSFIANPNAAIRSIEDAVAAAESGDTDAADKKLSTAITQLRVLLNELAAGNDTASGNSTSGGGDNGNNKGGAVISDDLRDRVMRSTGGSIELLDTARTAAVTN